MSRRQTNLRYLRQRQKELYDENMRKKNEPKILEEWRVVDMWWTDDPESWDWREIEMYDGNKIVQKRRSNTDDEWVKVDPPSAISNQ